jgi:hypothetical protein
MVDAEGYITYITEQCMEEGKGNITEQCMGGS